MGRWVWELSSLPDSPRSCQSSCSSSFLLSPSTRVDPVGQEAAGCATRAQHQGRMASHGFSCCPGGASPLLLPVQTASSWPVSTQGTAWGHILADRSVWAGFYSFKNKKCISVATKILIPFCKWCTQIFCSYHLDGSACADTALLWSDAAVFLLWLCHNSTFFSVLSSH